MLRVLFVWLYFGSRLAARYFLIMKPFEEWPVFRDYRWTKDFLLFAIGPGLD